MEVPPPESEGPVSRRMNDIRVLDAKGVPLYMQMGADEFIDSSWSIPAIEGIDEIAREEEFAMLELAAVAFDELSLPVEFEDLRLGVKQVGQIALERAAKDEASASIAPARHLQANIVWGPSSAAYWDYRIYRKDAFVSGRPFDHTAVQLRGWNSTKQSVVFTAVSCNHGTCAAVSPMTVKCVMNGWLTDDGTHSRYFYNEPSGTSAVTSGCSTAFSSIFDNGKHVCNDDTILQIHAIKYDSSYDRSVGATEECSDNDKNYWAPSCI